MQTNKPIKIIAKTALFNSDGKILVLTRSETDRRRPSGLDFPGGKIEQNEDILAGAAREIEEETGIVISPQEIIVLYAKTSPPDIDGVVVTRLFCAAKALEKNITLSFEHSAYKWCTVEEALEQFEPISWAQGLRFALEHKLLTLA